MKEGQNADNSDCADANWENVSQLIRRKEWSKLAELVRALLSCSSRRSDLRRKLCSALHKSSEDISEDEIQDGVQNTLEWILENEESFWDQTLKRCPSKEAFWVFLAGMFRDINRDNRCRDKDERGWLNQRTSDLLRKQCGKPVGGFQRFKSPYRIYYGLEAWPPLNVADGFSGDWNDPLWRDQLIARNPGFRRRVVSERKGPYSDEDVLEGCRLLLEICGKYCEPVKLADGLRTEWFCLLESTELPIDDRDQKSPVPSPAEIVAEREAGIPTMRWWKETLKAFSPSDWKILVERTLPEILQQGGSKTLEELAAEMGTSHTAINNREKKLLERLKRLMNNEEREFHLELLRKLVDLFENDGLESLIQNGNESNANHG